MWAGVTEAYAVIAVNKNLHMMEIDRVVRIVEKKQFSLHLRSCLKKLWENLFVCLSDDSSQKSRRQKQKKSSTPLPAFLLILGFRP
jgi:hypothetical protein